MARGDRKKKKDQSKYLKEDEWKRLMKVVDVIFEQTEDSRKQMDQNMENFNGRIFKEDELKSYDPRAFINMIFSTIQSIAPMLTDNPPIWTVVARKPHLARLAGVYNNALTYTWNVLDMDYNSMPIILDCFIMKKGITCSYFDTIKEEIVCDVVDPREFFICPGYDDEWDAPFMGERGKRPLTWVRARFPDVEDITIETSAIDVYENSAAKFDSLTSFEQGVSYVTVYKVWCRNEKAKVDVLEQFRDSNLEGTSSNKDSPTDDTPDAKFVFFTKNEFLGEEPCVENHGKPPYVGMDDYKVPHQFLSIAEPDQIRGLNNELNRILQKLIGYMRRYGDPNWMVDDAVQIPPDIEQQLFEGGHVFHWNSAMNSSSGPPIVALTEAQFNQALPQVLNIFMKIIEDMTGATDISKGRASKRDRQSASEVSILYEASHTRTRQKVRNWEHLLKRNGYLWVRLMQQFYKDGRDFYTKDTKTGDRVYDSVSNTREFALSTIRPEEEMQELRRKRVEKETLSKEDAEDIEDYERLITEFKEIDPVYFDFDIEIETNSTLPMDKQSVANLAVRLFEMKAIDRQAILETVKFPRATEISDRMEAQEEEQKTRRGPRRPPGGPPGMGGPGRPPQGVPG